MKNTIAATIIQQHNAPATMITSNIPIAWSLLISRPFTLSSSESELPICTTTIASALDETVGAAVAMLVTDPPLALIAEASPDVSARVAVNETRRAVAWSAVDVELELLALESTVMTYDTSVVVAPGVLPRLDESMLGRADPPEFKAPARVPVKPRPDIALAIGWLA